MITSRYGNDRDEQSLWVIVPLVENPSPAPGNSTVREPKYIIDNPETDHAGAIVAIPPDDPLLNTGKCYLARVFGPPAVLEEIALQPDVDSSIEPRVASILNEHTDQNRTLSEWNEQWYAGRGGRQAQSGGRSDREREREARRRRTFRR